MQCSPEMGWWKAHNIVEMGIELIVSSSGDYGDRIKSAFANHRLISEVDGLLGELLKLENHDFIKRVQMFAGLVKWKRQGVSLAEKYRLQTRFKHQVEIDTKR